MRVFHYDTEGFYIEPEFIKDEIGIPDGCTLIPPREGLVKAKFTGSEWVEGLSPGEVEAIKNQPVPLDTIEELQKQQTDLVFELMMKGVL